MRRLILILFDLAAVLSLMLCVGASGFWVRSYSGRIEAVRKAPLSQQVIGMSSGEFYIWGHRDSGRDRVSSG